MWATELISQKTWRRTVTSSLCSRFVLELIHFALIGYYDNQIRNSYVSDCNLSPYFAYLAEATYCPTTEFRLWKGQGRIRQSTFREEFLLVAWTEITRTNTLSETGIYKTSKNVDSTSAQGYDGAANLSMSSKFSSKNQVVFTRRQLCQTKRFLPFKTAYLRM